MLFCYLKENNIMRPKPTHRKTGPNWKGKASKNGETSLKSHMAHLKPLAGKVFYLDLPSNKIAESLERDIQHFGGSVEKFFSKEIKYLITNKREAKYIQCLKQDSPVPSPESSHSSPFPSRSPGQTDAVVTCRGKSLAERAVKEKERVQIHKILSNALEWGVKILYINDVIAYVEKKKKTLASQCPVATTNVKAEPTAKHTYRKHKGGRIHKPFIKVEDSSRHYCPLYLTMPNMAELNLKTVPPRSPFFFNNEDPARDEQQGKRSVKASTCEDQAAGRKKNKDKKRGGYCECCTARYENLTTHLQSERHKAFSKSDAYQVVDRLLSTLHTSFTCISTLIKRPKHIVSTAVVAPGPFGRSEFSSKRDHDATRIIKEELLAPVDSPEEPFPQHALKISPAPQSAPRIHCNGRKWVTASRRSKLQSMCRQKLLTSCPQKSAQNAETPPSSGERLTHSALLFPRVSLDVQVSHTDTQSLTPPAHQEPRSVSHLGSPDVITNQPAEADCNMESPGKANRSVSERDPSSQTRTSPVRKVKRKVKAYKRKRRKLSPKATCEEHVVQSDPCEDPLLTLWQLFYSSADSHVEFLGFDDKMGIMD
ncbi:protein DBF4 homolog A [Dunckerocampus dactyliophorus]|uniref:protein DBF4 homolog A n=1 Tax=Dunckerocampus dactyliophorus TaxID=161453 RepID=UPI0024052B1B|nr:protein DBF4 homolog A [Dunckerocampus dactyliophorus]XP_054638192.1 protein DBF4 homolog A [Dunckerocampus dactyliophorus]